MTPEYEGYPSTAGLPGRASASASCPCADGAAESPAGWPAGWPADGLAGEPAGWPADGPAGSRAAQPAGPAAAWAAEAEPAGWEASAVAAPAWSASADLAEAGRPRAAESADARRNRHHPAAGRGPSRSGWWGRPSCRAAGHPVAEPARRHGADAEPAVDEQAGRTARAVLLRGGLVGVQLLADRRAVHVRVQAVEVEPGHLCGVGVDGRAAGVGVLEALLLQVGLVGEEQGVDSPPTCPASPRPATRARAARPADARCAAGRRCAPGRRRRSG